MFYRFVRCTFAGRLWQHSARIIISYKNPYEVCGHLVYFSLLFHVTHTFHILWNSACHAFPVPLSFNKIRHQTFLFLCSFNFCSRCPPAGLERRRRKHLLTQGRWRDEIYENLSLRLRVNIYSAAYLDSIFFGISCMQQLQNLASLLIRNHKHMQHCLDDTPKFCCLR